MLELQVTRGARAILLVVGFTAMAFLLMAALGWWWWSNHRTEFDANFNNGRVQGEAFGKQTDQDGCLRETFDHIRKDSSIIAGIGHNMFLTYCLDEAKASARFCDDVPSPWSAFATAKWSAQRCRAESLENGVCSNVLTAVITECEVARQREDDRKSPS